MRQGRNDAAVLGFDTRHRARCDAEFFAHKAGRFYHGWTRMNTDKNGERARDSSNRRFVNPMKHLSFIREIWVQNGDAFLAEARGDGSAFAFAEVFEVQITHETCRVEDGDGNAGVFSGGINFGQAVAAGAEEFHAANGGETDG